jgi:hypothetical protein
VAAQSLLQRRIVLVAAAAFSRRAMDAKERVQQAFEKSRAKYGAVDPHTHYLRRLLDVACTREDWERLAGRIQDDGSLRT